MHTLNKYAHNICNDLPECTDGTIREFAIAHFTFPSLFLTIICDKRIFPRRLAAPPFLSLSIDINGNFDLTAMG